MEGDKGFRLGDGSRSQLLDIELIFCTVNASNIYVPSADVEDISGVEDLVGSTAGTQGEGSRAIDGGVGSSRSKVRIMRLCGCDPWGGYEKQQDHLEERAKAADLIHHCCYRLQGFDESGYTWLQGRFFVRRLHCASSTPSASARS